MRKSEATVVRWAGGSPQEEVCFFVNGYEREQRYWRNIDLFLAALEIAVLQDLMQPEEQSSSSGNCSSTRSYARRRAGKACKLRCWLHQKERLYFLFMLIFDFLLLFKFVNSKSASLFFLVAECEPGISREQALLWTLQGYNRECCWASPSRDGETVSSARDITSCSWRNGRAAKIKRLLGEMTPFMPMRRLQPCK